MIRYFIFVLTVLFFCVSAFDTAFSSARKIYSLDECLKIALQNATTVNKAKNQKKFSDAELL